MAKIQTERYFENVRAKYGDKVEILSEFQGRERPITICYRCEKHGDTVKTMVAKNVFDRAFNPCKECKKEKKSIATANAHKMSKEDLYNRLVEYCKTWNGKVLEKEWVSAKTVYHFKCDNPEHPAFESTADSLFSGKHGCPYCCGRAGNFEKDMDNIVITVARGFGSGGKRLSSRIADDLGMNCYENRMYTGCGSRTCDVITGSRLSRNHAGS